MNTPKKMVLIPLAAMLACIGSLPAWAVDGVVLIDQNKALAGNVTPGDAPGFPVTISVSGSYRLAGNLTVASPNDTGVEITADSVTLDLNGFSILGPVKCEDDGTGLALTCSAIGTGYGVFSQRVGANVVVQNGHVQGMGNSGIEIHGVVRDVVARSNGANGITADDVQNCAADSNRRHGISSSLIVNSLAVRNGQKGFTSSGTLMHSIARENHASGLECSSDTSYSGNTFIQNHDYSSSTPQLVGCAGRNAGGNFCNGNSCPP